MWLSGTIYRRKNDIKVMKNQNYNPENWGIIKKRGRKFVLIDIISSNVLDNSQGHFLRSMLWYTEYESGELTLF